MEKKKWRGPCCVAWNCSNRQYKRTEASSSNRNQDITFHRFPSKCELRAKWIKAIRRQDFVPSLNSRICSEHFKSSDFASSQKRRCLKTSAIPSVFSFPAHLQPEAVTPRRKLIKHSPKKKRTVCVKALRNFVAHDHSYYSTTPKEDCLTLKRKVSILQQKLRKTRRNLRNKLGQNRRLKEVIADLKNQHLIDSQAEAILQDSFSGMSLDLFRHVRANATRKQPCYLPKVSNFALSLHFLSPRAYDFIRPILNLPHPRRLRQWKASVHCSPGYLENMLKVAGVKACATSSPHCSLIVDEMSLRKDISWVPSQNRYCGFADFGQGPVGSSIASNALLFILVSLKGRWKAPVAYFLTDHICSTQLSSCVKEAICKAADHGLIVKTFIADGLRANRKAAIELGCNLDIEDLCTHFQHPHPKYKNEKVFFICDPPHMLKLFRIFLAERGIIKRETEQGVQTISWQFIKDLHDLQAKDSLYLANKLTNKHINFTNVKMKVNIAAQTLSSSVATAIDHLREDIKLPQFQGSEETCFFIRQIDRVFDTLNSKNPYAKGYKAALSESNKDKWQPFLQNLKAYLLSLQEPSGLPLHKGRRNQCVVGFIITAQSTIDLAEDLLKKQKYLLTYKFSQDHVEMFFGKIRQRSGWNNNPTSEQFRSSLKSLLMSSAITPSRHGNAVPLDDTVELILNPPSSNYSTDTPDMRLQCDSELLTAASQLESPFLEETDWRQSCLYYTAGFVARRTESKLKCRPCSDALFDTVCVSPQSRFLQRKNSGGLKIPSKGVITILQASEKAFRAIMPSPALMDNFPETRFIDLHIQIMVLSALQGKHNGLFPLMDNFPETRFIDLHIQIMVLSALQGKHNGLFPTLEDHFFGHEVGIETDHVTKLIKTVASFYIKMRLLKAGKLFHQRKILLGQTTKRTKLNKLVLFSGQ